MHSLAKYMCTQTIHGIPCLPATPSLVLHIIDDIRPRTSLGAKPKITSWRAMGSSNGSWSAMHSLQPSRSKRSRKRLTASWGARCRLRDPAWDVGTVGSASWKDVPNRRKNWGETYGNLVNAAHLLHSNRLCWLVSGYQTHQKISQNHVNKA